MAAPRKYPEELRERAIRMAIDLRRDPATRTGALRRVGEQLGINPETLRNWVRDAGASRPRGRRAAAPAEPPTLLEAENAALRQKVRELEEEREILRKAAKYFAGETRW